MLFLSAMHFLKLFGTPSTLKHQAPPIAPAAIRITIFKLANTEDESLPVVWEQLANVYFMFIYVVEKPIENT